MENNSSFIETFLKSSANTYSNARNIMINRKFYVLSMLCYLGGLQLHNPSFTDHMLSPTRLLTSAPCKSDIESYLDIVQTI